jgi:hypothetical protein
MRVGHPVTAVTIPALLLPLIASLGLNPALCRGSWPRPSPAAPGVHPPPACIRPRRASALRLYRYLRSDSWQLEEVMWRNEPYLLDQHTKRVYRQDQVGGTGRRVVTPLSGQAMPGCHRLPVCSRNAPLWPYE